MQRASQMFVERILKDELDRRESVDLRFGWRLNSFEQHGDGVNAEIENLKTGETASVKCGYLIGCDGGQSMVRKTLGIEYEGKSGEEVDFMMGRMLSVYFEAPALYEVMKTDARVTRRARNPHAHPHHP